MCPCVPLQEFLTATVFLGKLQRRENLMAAFQHFDHDSSGFITEEELLLVSRAADNRNLEQNMTGGTATSSVQIWMDAE